MSRNGEHSMTFSVACCAGRRLIMAGHLICSVCDGPALTQRIVEGGVTMPWLRVPPGTHSIVIKPITS